MFFDTSPVIVDVRTTACWVRIALMITTSGLEAEPGDLAVVDAVAHVDAGEHFGNATWIQNDIVSVASRIRDRQWHAAEQHRGALRQARERPDHGIVQVVVDDGRSAPSGAGR